MDFKLTFPINKEEVRKQASIYVFEYLKTFDNGDFFHVNREQIYAETCGKHYCLIALENLLEKGFIEIKLGGLPRKAYYKILK